MNHHISAGQVVLVLDARDDSWVPAHALSGVVPGHKFPVVWVCFCADGNHDRKPWPADAVRETYTEVGD
jgi:hypothetical protein